MSTDKPRYTITVDDETFQKIENFRFDNRFQSRSVATLELVKMGMDTLEQAARQTGLSEKELLTTYLKSPENFMELLLRPTKNSDDLD